MDQSSQPQADQMALNLQHAYARFVTIELHRLGVLPSIDRLTEDKVRTAISEAGRQLRPQHALTDE